MSVSEVSINSSSMDCFTTISGTDLDEMFVRNLQLLKSMEENERSSICSDQSSKRYHSSLNVFISPRGTTRHSDGICYSYCNIAPIRESKNSNQNHVPWKTSGQLTKTFSSYETLYDNLISDPIGHSEHNGSRTSIRSAIEKNNVKSFEIRNVHKDYHSDSDRTLKSVSSEDISSSVSSLESQSDTREIPFAKQNCSTTSLLHLSNTYIPQLRSLKTGSSSRPLSCYVDTKFGRYPSNRYPSRPDMVVKINRGSFDRSNFVISKPLGSYPSRLCNSFVSFNDGIINNRIQNLHASPFDANFDQFVPVDGPHIPIYNRHRSSSNILNNNVVKK